MKPFQFAWAIGPLAWVLVLIQYANLQVPIAMAQGLGQPGGTCSDTVSCYQGCCSKDNQCGFTDDHCGDGCKHNCDATAECGKFAVPGAPDCPINVCCSEFGYCGVSTDFCGDGCQPNSLGGGCGQPERPKCSVNTDALSYPRRIAYYELFNLGRGCNVMEPENIIAAPLTHINLAFINFGDDYRLVDTDGDAVDRISVLKFDNAGLKVNIAVGGWAFSDPPTQKLWSEMTSTYPNRQAFIESVVQYLRNYHLDGIDLDWEYPAATDRGGNPDDTPNFINLLNEMREAFDREDPGWEISVTLPTSYWYLRGFDLERMQQYVDYFNLMSYDLHGMWDQDIEWTGPYLRGHTDIQQVEEGLDLLWRNSIKPEKLVFGLAFYGRSFTMASADCHKPDGVCQFTGGGRPGSCSSTSGILTFAEISARNKTLDVETFYNPETTVKYNAYDGDQWISYDDEQSFFDKKKFLSERCLSGLMIWAIDQDDGNFNALTGVFGEDVGTLQMSGGGLDEKAQDALADMFGAYTGQDCFVTPRCTDGSSRELNPDQVCPSGFMSVDTAHNPLQAPGHELHGACSEGWYRHICCPRKAMPKNCEWNGAPDRSAFGCDGQCGENQFKLNQDTSLDAKGEGSCFTGHRSLCCDSTTAISRCHWTECQGLLASPEQPSCPAGFNYMTYRLDKPGGKPWCSDTWVTGDGLTHGWSPHYSMKSALCCPEEQTPRGCSWTNDNFDSDDLHSVDAWDLVCKPRQCPRGSVEFASGLHPATSKAQLGASGFSCGSTSLPPQTDAEFSFCCDPPSKYNKNWPVDPKYLWEQYYNDPEKSDVVWEYSDEFEKNDNDDERAPSGAEDGSDAYGFVMLDGPEGSIDNSFADTQTVVRRSVTIPRTKRSVLTSNQTVMDSVFDHHEETFYVYCNYPIGSRECERIFIDGAEDTIIRLPDHVGEGPFARIVSMELAHEDYQLPDHHVEHRRSKRNENPIYRVKIDYDFQEILPKRADDPVYIRVDYTNLLGYWDEMTNSPVSRMKRGMGEEGLTKTEWKNRVQRAASRDQSLRKGSENPIEIRTPMDMSGSHIDKRWWGAFKDWLRKLTTITKSELGVIPLSWARTINLFSAHWNCPGSMAYADLTMDLQANFNMDATYAYYLSATFIPPGKPEAFAYFGMEPTAYLGLHIEGNAVVQKSSERKKIIDTLSYPGLAVKGIAAVGPTLDVYGQIRGKLTLHGEADAGATVSFGKAEVYWPQDDEAKDQYETLLGIESKTQQPAPFTVEPVFRAGVAVDAQIDIIVTPEANVGIRIGGGKLVGGTMLMDAQLTGYVMGDLSFQAHADYDTDSNEINYSFGVWFLYNIGYKATAKILGFIDWAREAREAYKPDRSIKLYEFRGTVPMSEPEIVEARHTWRNDTPLIPSDLTEGLVRRADPNADANSAAFTAPTTCPPGSSGDLQLIELRISCTHLSPVAVEHIDGGSARSITGLCTPILNIPADKRVEVFTFSNNDPRKKARMDEQCPSSSCTGDQKTFNEQLGRVGGYAKLKLQCDEFPWKSSEQGGSYMDLIGPGLRTQTCVPSYQNNWHAACIRMMGQIQSNWQELEPEPDENDPQKEYWLQWGGTSPGVKGWETQGEKGKEGSRYVQRLKEYPTRQPMPDGVQTRPNENWSWVFKRDYRVSWLKQPTLSGSDYWGATKWDYVDKGKNPNKADSIICAVNHFNQKNVYKYPVHKGSGQEANGVCYITGGTSAANGNWPKEGSYVPCKVDFAPPSASDGNTKRDWVVTNVTHLDPIPDNFEDE